MAYAAAQSGQAPTVATQAPDFTLHSQQGQPVSLHDFHGKWVVLYFHPKDFTSGSTVEARNFQRDLEEYEKRNAVILGVSTQDEKSHEGFAPRKNWTSSYSGAPGEKSRKHTVRK